ncbi:MAG: sigma-54-dependent Fis family transcriptional regulator [Deltaproteobacteria bacterium]|nr:sigma-54-dependent Fis family transcriptional regulator [Deltaproteobacteria bacterium]
MADRILIVDDDPDMQFVLGEALRQAGYQVEAATSAEAGLEALRARPTELVILDVRLPGMSGLEAVPRVKELVPEAPIIIMTAHGRRELALEAIQRGAYDFFVKPFSLPDLKVVVQRALERRALEGEVRQLRERLGERYEFARIIGQSPPMREVIGMLRKVVETDATVLITGESGTGKERIAEAIHYNSRRRSKPFVKLNCVAIPEGLLESELFGHEKGAFTGAVARKLGKFELANGGTIFLDEIGDMSLATQAKILRILQESEFERVGGTATIKIDVRVIAATNRALTRAIKERQFREDLFYRLNVFSITLPPLRERLEDLPALAELFVAEANARLGRAVKGVGEPAMARLMGHTWPGNVRELQHAIERAMIMCEGEWIGPEDLPFDGGTSEVARGLGVNLDAPLDVVLQEVERQLVLQALQRTGGVQARAAELLKITERSLWYLVKKHRIEVEAIKRAAQPAGLQGT